MLAIGRALSTNPRLLILDEATEGLAPVIREEIWRCLAALKAAGQHHLGGGQVTCTGSWTWPTAISSWNAAAGVGRGLCRAQCRPPLVGALFGGVRCGMLRLVCY